MMFLGPQKFHNHHVGITPAVTPGTISWSHPFDQYSLPGHGSWEPGVHTYKWASSEMIAV